MRRRDTPLHEQEYFAEGMTEDLTTDLSRIPGSFVIAPKIMLVLTRSGSAPDFDIVYPETRSEKPCRFNGRSFIDPGCARGPWQLIRFRHFIDGSLALASLNLACRDHVPTFPQRSPPSLLTTAACGGLRSTPDCRPRRVLLHLSYSCTPSFGPAMLVTQDPKRTWLPLASAGYQWAVRRGGNVQPRWRKTFCLLSYP